MIVQAKEDYYAVLEIEVSSHISEVDPSTIKKAFRKLALIYHPDKGKEAGDVIFKNLNRVYEVLIDPTKKSEYDNWYKKFYKRTHVTQNHIAKERTKKQKMEQAELRRMKEESGKKNQAEKDAKVQEAERERKAREKQKREEEVLKKRREEEKRKVEEKLRKERMEKKKKEQERANEEKEQKLRAEQALRDEKARKLREEVLKKQSAERVRKEKLKQRSEELKNLFTSNEENRAKGYTSQSAYQHMHQGNTNSGWSNPQYYASSDSPQNGEREFARPRTSHFKEQHMSKADFHKKIRKLQEEAEKCHEDREKFTDECEDFDKKAERIEISAKKALEKAEKKYRDSIAKAEVMFNKAKSAQESANMAHSKMELYLNEYEELFDKYGNIYGEPNSEEEEEVSEGSEEDNESLEPETPKPFKFDFKPPKTDDFQLKSNPWKTYIDTCKSEKKVLSGSMLEKQAQIFIFFQFTSNYPVPSMFLLYCKSKMKLNSTPATHRNTRNKLALETRDLWNKAVQEAFKAQSS